MIFEGAYTALVTPFAKDGKVDYGRLAALVEEQIAGGVAGLVPVGTSGESPTLSHEEHIDVIRAVVETVHGRVQVIAGAGSNSTAEALHLTAKEGQTWFGEKQLSIHSIQWEHVLSAPRNRFPLYGSVF